MDKKYLKKLTPEEIEVIVKKGTERPYSGKYNDFYKEGLYFVRLVTIHYFTPMTSLIQIVDGLRLMTK